MRDIVCVHDRCAGCGNDVEECCFSLKLGVVVAVAVAVVAVAVAVAVVDYYCGCCV